MSALSTPGGGGTTAQTKPTSGKQKYQKLDINSLYCANRNENSEPSSVKSQLSRKHGMQSLGKVPSARRPPANLPSLKTETGQDPNANPISAATTTVSTPATCSPQTTITTSNSGVVVGTGPGGWVPLPPPSSPHFRTEFPSLEAAAQPSHRTSDHSAQQPQLRPQTEGSWTSGGAAARAEATSSPAAAPASTPAAQQPPAFRAILPSFLMKGSNGSGLGLGTLGSLREGRSAGASGSPSNANIGGSRPAPRPLPVTPRAVEVLTARPILRDEQISSLDDISRDAGWAQNDDIDYDQKLDFSDGESTAPCKSSNNKNNNRASMDTDRAVESKIEPGDEDQLWAERRQKKSNEVAQVAARGRQRKEEEQRRQMRDTSSQQQAMKDNRGDRGRNDNNRDREHDVRENRERLDNRDRERLDNRDRDRIDNREKERDMRDRDSRDKERIDRDRGDNKDRFERERDRDIRDRDRDQQDIRDRDRQENRDRDRQDNRDWGRMDNRDRQENDKDRMDNRERDRNDNRDRVERERFDRDRCDRERDRDREHNRDRLERDRNDRDFRDRDRDYGRDRDQNNPAFSKAFQANIPPRFLKQQQSRQQEEQHKNWAFSNKSAPRRQEPPSYNTPRNAAHNGRRSYSRDYSDREDDFRREKDVPGPQWRSEMQDYDRSGRELDRSNSKESYKEYDYKERRNDSDRRPSDITSTIENSNRTAADKLTEVFERKSIGMTQSLGSTDWAEVTQEEPNSQPAVKSSIDKVVPQKELENTPKEPIKSSSVEAEANKSMPQPQQSVSAPGPQPTNTQNNSSTCIVQQTQSSKYQNNQTSAAQNFPNSHQTQTNSYGNNQIQPAPVSQSIEQTSVTKQVNQTISTQLTENVIVSQTTKQSSEQLVAPNNKPTFTTQKPEIEHVVAEPIASKSSTEPSGPLAAKGNETTTGTHNVTADAAKITNDDKRAERFNTEHSNKISAKEPIERKSSGSGSEKKSRGYGGGNSGFAVYNNRGWGPRESRGRRSHRSSRSNNRASESDGSTDGAPNPERKERRRAPRSPRGPKKNERLEDPNRPRIMEQTSQIPDGVENKTEPFAPRGQPSRRGRGGFQGTSRPPAPAKRVAGYGPPNTKSPFSQANRANKDNDENSKDNLPVEDKLKGNNKPRTGPSMGRGRDRRPKGAAGPLSCEDENWETTSEHSEGGGNAGRRRSVGGRQAGQSQKGRNQNSGNRQNAGRNQGNNSKKDVPGDTKTNEVTEAMSDLKLSSNNKKDDDVVDDGFQEVRNKKNSKDTRGPQPKEDNMQQTKQPRSHSNQGGGRNGSSSRNGNDKGNSRAPASASNKSGPQYDRPRQANLAPRFVKQRQKQMGLVSAFGPDTGAAPPPPTVNAWDKPISQTLRGNVEEPVESAENKSAHSSQRSTPAETVPEVKPASQTATPCALASEKTGVLDGTTPPVETIIFENTNYKTAPPAEALKQKYQPSANTAKPQEDMPGDVESRQMPFNGDVRARPRSIQELIGDNNRPPSDGDNSLGIQMSFDATQKQEDSSDMKLDFAFDSDLGQLTEDKSAKTLGLPRGVHMSTSNTISPLAADLNLKIASVKKVWEMPAVAEGSEELQFTGFEENNTETGAPPNVCKVKPTQQLQSPPPQHYNHVGYQGGYSGLSVPSPPAVLFNSSQQLLGSSQQLPQQGGLYGAFLDHQTRGQFGGFPGTPYGAGSAAPYNYQPPPDMFQSLPNQYRMAAAGGGAAFGQSGQIGNNPSTVLISSTSNSLMSATVKPSSQQIGAIGSKGVGVGVGGVNTYQQQYLGYSGPVGEAPYSLPGLLPRPAPPATSYYSPYQPPAAPAPTYPLQFTQPAQSGAFGSQFLSSQLQVAAAVQQMQQQYRTPLQQQYAPPQPRPPPQQLKSPLHEHANGFAPLPMCEAASPTPKGAAGAGKQLKPPHSPPHHKYHAAHPPPPHTPHQHHHHQQHHHQQHQQQMVGGGGVGRGGGARGLGPPRYPAPIQRPPAPQPAPPLYRTPAQPRHHAPRHNLYYPQRNGGAAVERAAESGSPAATADEPAEATPTTDAPQPAEVKAE